MPCSFVYRESCLTGTHLKNANYNFYRAKHFTKFVLEFYGLHPKEKM